MKTTVEIADPLFEQARAIAEAEGVALRALIEEGLRTVVDKHGTAKRFRLRDGSFAGGSGLSEEFANGGWEKIRAAIYGEPE